MCLFFFFVPFSLGDFVLLAELLYYMIAGDIVFGRALAAIHVPFCFVFSPSNCEHRFAYVNKLGDICKTMEFRLPLIRSFSSPHSTNQYKREKHTLVAAKGIEEHKTHNSCYRHFRTYVRFGVSVGCIFLEE